MVVARGRGINTTWITSKNAFLLQHKGIILKFDEFFLNLTYVKL